MLILARMALWPQDKSALPPLPLHPCAIAPVSQGRASRPLRLTLDTNRSALPAHLAGPALTLQTSPDRRWLSLGKHRIARQVRRDDRDGACEAPEHPHPLLAQRHKARAHPLVRRFRTRAPRAAASSLTRAQRRLTPHHPVRTLVALRDLYGHEAGARAMEDAFASEYIAHVLAQGARFIPEASAFHLPRRAARLAGRVPPPARSLYHAPPQPTAQET